MNEYIFTYHNKSIVINAKKLTEAMAIAEEHLQPSGYGYWETKSRLQEDGRNFKWVLGNFNE